MALPASDTLPSCQGFVSPKSGHAAVLFLFFLLLLLLLLLLLHLLHWHGHLSCGDSVPRQGLEAILDPAG